MSNINICVVMPTRGTILTETQSALERELALCHQNSITLRTWDMPLPASRNFLIESALKFGWTHILLIDDDVILPKDGLKELINLKADVAVMDYPMRGLVGGKSVGTVVHEKKGSLAWAGLGAVLVKREVFGKIQQPWFIFTNYRINRDKDGRLGFYAGQHEGQLKFSGGEDVHFFLQARKEKFTIKIARKIAQHAYVEQIVSPVSNAKYQTQHKIVKRDKIEEEAF